MLSLLKTQAVSDQSEWLLPKVPRSGHGIPSLQDKSGTSPRRRVKTQTDVYAYMHEHRYSTKIHYGHHVPTSLPAGLELSSALFHQQASGDLTEAPCSDGDTRPREVKS